jgi:uncharacterized protein YecT (DUF1311 family)
MKRALVPAAAVAAAALAAGAASVASGAPASAAAPATCGDAATTAGMRECLDGRLRSAQANLDRALARLRAVPGVDRTRLDAAQAAFTRYRDAECGFAASLNAGGTLAAVNDLACRVGLTKQRLAGVRRSLAQAAPEPAAVPRCHTGDLRARQGAGDAALGNRRTNFILTNASRHVCAVRGYPGMAVLDASGAVLRDVVERGSGYLVTDPGPRRVVLAPGRSASYSLGFSGDVVEGCAGGATVRITPPDERAFLTVDSVVTVCPGQPLNVSALVRGTRGAPPPA